MDYDRIRQIASNHHLEVTDNLLEAMKQVAGEVAQDMRKLCFEALENLHLPDKILTELNRTNK